MRLKISKSKNASSLYVIKDYKVNGKRTTKIVEKLGTLKELTEKLDGVDPIEWANSYIDELNRKEQENTRDVLVKFSSSKLITKDKQFSYNGGYLFIQQLYYQLGLHNICKYISNQYKFNFDLNDILSKLTYSRILFPRSKKATHESSKKYLEKPNFELHQIYRALEVIAKESDYIQSELYKNSLKISRRNTGILYYDCTNYFFEIEEENGLKQYGVSKEHRPNPIVQMGLFMDGDGVPLAFSINKGNTNEQTTLRPLEKKILEDFDLSKIVVCTDAGLASTANRKFNNTSNRAFITTQSIKKLDKKLKSWALDKTNWKLIGKPGHHDLDSAKEALEKTDDSIYRDYLMNATFYKEYWSTVSGLEQRLIVTFSFKYQKYLEKIRNKQIERAHKLVSSSPKSIGKARQNDYKRFISKISTTENGEVADETNYFIDQEVINKEAIYDGFYGVCTNLEDDVSKIIKVNKQRWQIEECFRILKTEFKSRPVYLSRDDRIQAHFTTCFIALMIYRLLEKKLENKYTICEIIDQLKEMNFYHVPSEGYIPTYTRTNLSDDLHDKFGFRTDFQIVSLKNMKKIIRDTKK